MHALSPTLRRESAEAMWEHYLGGQPPTRDDMRYVVPALAPDLTGVAPAHITVAEHDVLRDEGIAYAQRLAEAGVWVDLDLVAGAVHGFDGLLPEGTLARAALAKQIGAIASALGRASG
jgi:acetyl esterase/lipase